MMLRSRWVRSPFGGDDPSCGECCGGRSLANHARWVASRVLIQPSLVSAPHGKSAHARMYVRHVPLHGEPEGVAGPLGEPESGNPRVVRGLNRLEVPAQEARSREVPQSGDHALEEDPESQDVIRGLMRCGVVLEAGEDPGGEGVTATPSHRPASTADPGSWTSWCPLSSSASTRSRPGFTAAL